MRAIFIIALLVATSVRASETIRPTLDMSGMRLEVHWVDSKTEIDAARREYGVTSDRYDSAMKSQEDGFAALLRINGELVCRLFVQKPRHLNDDRTTALGHELLHCLAGNYH